MESKRSGRNQDMFNNIRESIRRKCNSIEYTEVHGIFPGLAAKMASCRAEDRLRLRPVKPVIQRVAVYETRTVSLAVQDERYCIISVSRKLI